MAPASTSRKTSEEKPKIVEMQSEQLRARPSDSEHEKPTIQPNASALTKSDEVASEEPITAKSEAFEEQKEPRISVSIKPQTVHYFEISRGNFS